MTLNPATTDAFRNIAVVEGTFPEATTTTVAAEIVGDTLTITGGFGITLTADPATDSIIINNTGDSVGAYTEITDANANATYYPVFSRPLDQTPFTTNPVTGEHQLDTLYIDFTTTPMSYNPATSTLTASTFTGNLTGNVTGNVSGNAGTVTNGVYTTGSYSDPTWLTISQSKVGLGNVTNESKATMFTSPIFTGHATIEGQTLTGVTGTGKLVLDNAPTITGHPTIEGVTSTGATGTGKLVFDTSPTISGHPTVEGVTSTGATGTGKFVFDTSPTITGHPTVEGVTSTGATGTGKFVFDTSPTFSGTVSGITQTMVGLGNVTNESKATMFTNSTFTGTTNVATLQLTNPLGISYGGTGANSASGALTNLLPAGAVSGYILKTSGPGTYYWAAETGASTVVGTKIDTSRVTFTATAGQTLFTGVGTYSIGAGQLRVYIDGVRQNPDAYTETSTTSFTLSAGVPVGTKVLAEVDGYKDFTVVASAVTFSAVGGIASTNVQDALAELDTEKAPLASPSFTGHITTEGVTATGATGTGKFVFDTTPTFTTSIDSGPTFGAFGSSTTLTMGYTGTSANSTYNLSTAALSGAYTKTINIGTGGNIGSTTAINIGSTINSTTTFNGHVSIEGVTSTGATGTGNLVFNNGATLIGTTTVGTLLFAANGFTISQSGSKILFAYNGTTVLSIDSSGNMIAKQNITAYGTP